MASYKAKLQAALVDATCEVFKAEPDATTVNKVRKRAETNLDLEEGFFASADWKQMSKDLIKTHVEKLLDGWDPDAKREDLDEEDVKSSKKKNGVDVKRSSSGPDSKPALSRRRASHKKSFKEESSASDFDMSEDEKKPKKKAKAKAKVKTNSSDDEDAKPRPKKGRGRVVSDDEDEDMKDSPTADSKRKREADEDDDIKDVPMKSGSDTGDEDKSAVKKRRLSEDEIKLSLGDVKEEEDPKPAVDEEEEYSDVIDEPAAPRDKKKGAVKKEPKAKPAKASSSSKKSASATTDTPQETEIKKLQGQLVKCGVRKLWHNELKKYGDDDRAKIRHLKKMLADVGMDGRFSESRAREIKESRELLAEVEAAQDMDSLWGTSGRASRSRGKAKNMKIDTDSEDEDVKGNGVKDDNNDEDDDDDEAGTAVAAKRRARADLAFLGSDSDSD